MIPFRFCSLILYISKIILKEAIVKASKRLFIKSTLHQNWLHLAFTHSRFKCLEIYSWRSRQKRVGDRIFSPVPWLQLSSSCHTNTTRYSLLSTTSLKENRTSRGLGSGKSQFKAQRIRGCIVCRECKQDTKTNQGSSALSHP